MPLVTARKGLGADEAVADLFRKQIDGDDDQQDQDADRADFLIDVEADHPLQFLADAAGADEADDGRGADIDLKPQQCVAEEAGQHLRHHAVTDLRKPGAADGADALDRPQVGVFVQFGEQFSQRAGGVDGDREDAGQWADAERPDQDEGQHDLRDGTHELQQAAGDEDHDAVADEGAGGRETQRERHGETDRGGQDRHLDGLPQQRRVDVDAIEPVGDRLRLLHAAEQVRQGQHGDRVGAALWLDREQFAEILADAGQAVGDPLRGKVRRCGGDDEQQDDGGEGQHRLGLARAAKGAEALLEQAIGRVVGGVGGGHRRSDRINGSHLGCRSPRRSASRRSMMSLYRSIVAGT